MDYQAYSLRKAQTAVEAQIKFAEIELEWFKETVAHYSPGLAKRQGELKIQQKEIEVLIFREELAEINKKLEELSGRPQ